MRFTFILVFLLYNFFAVQAQLITTVPAIPIDSKAVKVIFNAAEGTGGLKGFSGDVYAHTGVITDKSSSGSDWKYVKTNWGQNTAETKLERVDTDLYELELTPDIRTYYGVPEGEIILKIALVFRSEDNSLEGKDDGGTDIFIDVFMDGFNLQIDQPGDNLILDPGESLDFSISTTEEAEIGLYINDIAVAQQTGTSLNYTHLFEDTGNYWIYASADNGTTILFDTLFVCVRQAVVLEALPSGWKKGINYLDDYTVGLVLWAPYKTNVFILGDFTDWRPSNDFQMRKDGNYFWFRLTDLEKSKPYVYQYLIDGELLIADPYTDQVSDPFNDRHIPQSVYPDLVPYPFQKTNGMAAVFQTAQEPFIWEVENFTPVEKEKLLIYELLVRDFQDAHSYDAVIDKLDYLQTLGINVLELMPVNEFEGNSSWGYNPAFYFAPDKYYGPKSKLKKLIDECHKRGIAVFIDMVLNHSYGQSPFAQMYLEGGKPSVLNPWYNREHNFTNPDAHWGYDFNHESPHTQELVDSINSYWINEFKVDGFRFDFTKGFGNNIKNNSDSWGSIYDPDRIALLKRMSDEIWQRNPKVIVCFEHLSDNAEERELAEYGILLWGNMNHNYGEGAMGYNSGNKSDFSWGLSTTRGWDVSNLITYMESHDEERVMYKISQWGNFQGSYNTTDEITAAERIGLNAVFFLPLPGPKMIWQFGELGYDISIDQGCRVCEKPILWEYFGDWQRKNIYDIMTNLNFLKQNYPIFNSEDITHSLKGEVKMYRYSMENEHLIAVGNFGITAVTSNVVFPETGLWYDYFNGTSFEVDQNNMEITIQAGAYNIYSTMPLEQKVTMTPRAIGEITNKPEFDLFTVYPNPSSSAIQWNYSLKSAHIYSSDGKHVFSANENDIQSKTLDIEHLSKGGYIIFGEDENGNSHYTKFIR